MGAEVRSEDALKWINDWLPDEVASGRKGADCMTAHIKILQEFTHNGYLGTFDCPQYFDYIEPMIANDFFKHLGLPENVANLLYSMLGQQERHLQYGGASDTQPYRAGASTPQGDP